MNGLLASWESACASSKALRFVDINLRAVGQVMFQNNPLSGAFFLAAIAWGSFASGAARHLFLRPVCRDRRFADRDVAPCA